jgi:hypothetical protein
MQTGCPSAESDIRTNGTYVRRIAAANATCCSRR